jgi:hypothetical protein
VSLRSLLECFLLVWCAKELITFVERGAGVFEILCWLSLSWLGLSAVWSQSTLNCPGQKRRFRSSLIGLFRPYMIVVYLLICLLWIFLTLELLYLIALLNEKSLNPLNPRMVVPLPSLQVALQFSRLRKLRLQDNLLNLLFTTTHRHSSRGLLLGGSVNSYKFFKFWTSLHISKVY